MDLAALAHRQHGLVTRAQALERLTPAQLRWRLTSRRWRTIHPGVYAVHLGPLDWAARAEAALLAYGPHAALARESAAYVLGLLAAPPSIIQVDMSHPHTPRPLPGTRVRRRRRLPTQSRRGMLVTAPAFTVIDLGQGRGKRADDAIAFAARAIQQRVTTVDEVVAELAERRAVRHRAAILLSLGVLAQGGESLLEIRFVRRVLRAHGLPPMVMSAPTASGLGRIRRDFEHLECGVIVEVDGRVGHVGDGRLRDHRRDRQAAASGKVTLRAGWEDVSIRPCEIAAEVYSTLRARGYLGNLRSCGPRCGAQKYLAGSIRAARTAAVTPTTIG